MPRMDAAGHETRPFYGNPLFHFLVLGFALFALDLRWSEEELPEIVVSAARVEQLEADALRHTGRSLTDEERRGLIETEIDDELLVARALELGLHRESPIRGRLIELAAFLGEKGSEDHLLHRALELELHRRDPEARQRLKEKTVAEIAASDPEYAEGEPPPDAVLEELLHSNAETYRRPALFRLTQVFVAGETAQALLEAERRRRTLISSSAGPEGAEAVSDPGPLPVHLDPLTRRQLVLRFGDEIADGVEDLEPGSWSPPLPAANGAHLFWVHERIPERMPTLDEARDQVLRHWLTARREARVLVALEELQQRYRVRVETLEEAPATAVEEAS